MSKIDRQTSIFTPKFCLTLTLIVVLSIYFIPRALDIFRLTQYRTKLKNFIQVVNSGVTNKSAFYQETFVDMYGYIATGMGQTPLTPLSYIFGKNSCDEPIDSDRFKSPVLSSSCVDGTIISSSNICFLRSQPRIRINDNEYYMLYIDLDCKSGRFNKDLYNGSNFVDIDNYAIDMKYDDIYPLIFTLKEGNFFVSIFPDKNDPRWEKTHKLLACRKNIFFDTNCK